MKHRLTFATLGREQQYQKMIEEVEDYAILLLDLDGKVQNWNKGAEKIKGYTEAEIVGKNFSQFYLPQDQNSNLPKTLINQAIENGRATDEGWRVRKDGSTFWASVVITALHDKDRNVVGFTKVTRDLTERKLAEEEKTRDTRNIEMQNRQLEEFAYITSHDLQEPIRKIQTFINLAQKNVEDKELLDNYLLKMSSTANKMAALIKDVLHFSLLSQNKNEFITVNLMDVLVEVIDELDLLIQDKNAIVKFSTLPILNAIPVQMHQLFTNLIHNALKFSKNRPFITIHHKILKSNTLKADKEKFHIITFSDNGIGFDQQYAEMAFKPFKRLTVEYPGTGIGLALCKRIVENHSGTISVVSILGKGTTFTISLPYTNIS